METLNVEWRQAIYNGKLVNNLFVSNTGLMRRGADGEITRGTPNYDRRHKYIRSYEVCIMDPDYKWKHRAVNLHRIVYETFTELPWIDGNQLDHIDRTKRGDIDNLRCVTRSENMKNRGPYQPVAGLPHSLFRYRMQLKYGVDRLSQLPPEIQKQYHKMQAHLSYERRKNGIRIRAYKPRRKRNG